jgi:hypothetical protein
MASNFPSSLDTFTNPSSTDAMDSVSVPHATQHSDLNDAVEALQAKVGANSSAVTTSHDYKIADHASRLTTLEGQGSRTSFTPALYLNITIGNGTEEAYYTLVGDLMCVEYVLIFGSTTSISGLPVIGLPSGYSRATGTDVACGQGMLRDQGTRNYNAYVQTNLNGLSLHTLNGTATSTYIDVVSSTFPFTWTTGDAIRFNATLQVTT